MLNNLVGFIDDAAVAAAAPPRSRPTTLDTKERDGIEMLAHIFMRVPIEDSGIICLVRHAPKVRTKGEDEKEQGATARDTVASRWFCCCCWVPTNGELDDLATLPKAVTGAINVSSSNWEVKENFTMMKSSCCLLYGKHYEIIFGFPGLGQKQNFFIQMGILYFDVHRERKTCAVSKE